jgi:hypothetical protein
LHRDIFLFPTDFLGEIVMKWTEEKVKADQAAAQFAQLMGSALISWQNAERVIYHLLALTRI